MSKKLPILISVPHGGQDVPGECRAITELSAHDIFHDSDGFTREIYDFKERVTAFKDTNIARAFVDLNRRRDDKAPKNPDGVIKSETVQGIPVYKKDMFPAKHLVEELLEQYYDPYHCYIKDIITKNEVILALDCHSMLDYAPESSPKPGERRPLICISNGADSFGLTTSGYKSITCDPTLLTVFADLLAETFDIPREEVQLNVPFSGGAIIRTHANKGIPWIQLELNRSFYLTSKSFNENTLWCDPNLLQGIRERIWNVIVRLLTYLD